MNKCYWGQYGTAADGSSTLIRTLMKCIWPEWSSTCVSWLTFRDKFVKVCIGIMESSKNLAERLVHYKREKKSTFVRRFMSSITASDETNHEEKNLRVYNASQLDDDDDRFWTRLKYWRAWSPNHQFRQTIRKFKRHVSVTESSFILYPRDGKSQYFIAPLPAVRWRRTISFVDWNAQGCWGISST